MVNRLCAGGSEVFVNLKAIRRTLLLSSTVAMSGIAGYGRSAYAACVQSPPSSSTYLCSGAVNTDTQPITADNATVSTRTGFSIDTRPPGSGGNAIEIIAGGSLSFTDAYQSSITGQVNGLFVSGEAVTIEVNGDLTGVEQHGILAEQLSQGSTGNVTVTTGIGSTVTGGEDGIRAVNNSLTGNLAVTANGDVRGNAFDGIFADLGDSSDPTGSVSVTTGAGSYVYGYQDGIDARNAGRGATRVIVNGDVLGKNTNGLYVGNANPDATGSMEITTGAGSTITGYSNGINARNNSSGNQTVEVNGNVYSTGQNGGAAINVRNTNDFVASDLTLTTAAGTKVEGVTDGIFASTSGRGSVIVEANGDVTGLGGAGIDARIIKGNGNADPNIGDLRITTGADSRITGDVYGIRAYNNDIGDLVVTVQGDVYGYGTSNYTHAAIFANNRDSYGAGDLIITTGPDSRVFGYRYGIWARTYGTGNLSIDVAGTVTGDTARDGIYATIFSGSGAGRLEVTTAAGSDVKGDDYGIRALSSSREGDLAITANGAVSGFTSDGILANLNSSQATGALTVTTGAGSSVYGQRYGIYATHAGSGAVDIDIAGSVTSNSYDGISAINSYDGTALNVTTAASAVITGERDGIKTRSKSYYGGTHSIVVDGDVEGKTGDGIQALNYYASANLYVSTAAGSSVKGSRYGVHAVIQSNDVGSIYPTGVLSIEADGEVNGGQAGIQATNYNEYSTGVLSVTTGAGSRVTGNYGIRVSRYGSGDVTVDVAGDVSGYRRSGIMAEMESGNSTADLKVVTAAGSSVYGRQEGIYALSFGAGDLTIEVNGDVESETRSGIHADISSNGNGNMLVTTSAGSSITAAEYGIWARNGGYGDMRIAVDGDVSGYDAGVRALTSYSQITLDVSGHVFNRSGAAGNLSIRLRSGAETYINNAGRITGTLDLTAFDDTFTNDGTWNTASVSEFGQGDDDVLNNGLVRAGGTEGAADTTEFIDLERLVNAGTISMVDEAKNGGSSISDNLLVDDYTSDGGRLALDVALGAGPGSVADVLTVRGSTSGTTFIVVNETQAGPGQFNPDGIVVATVEGAHSASDFDMLGGYYSSGLYSYDIVYEQVVESEDDDGRFLIKGFAGLHAFEVAAVVSGAQNVFFDTVSSWADRQNQLRDWLGRQGVVTAAADPPVAEEVDGSGLWLTVRGTKAEREAEASITALDSRYDFDTGYDQTTWSIMGGADFGASLGSGTLLFGALAGYVSSSQELNASETEIDYEGGTFGAYASYLNNGFFASLLGKADLFTVDYDAAGAGGSDDEASGTSLGFRADAGYRFGFGHGGAYLEPVASLAAVWTEIDDFSLYDSTAEPGTNDALHLGGGARFGFETSHLAVSLTGRVWDVLSDGNEVGLVVPGTDLTSVTDPSFEGTFGEVSGQAAYRIGQRTEASLAASYLFNDEQTTLTGAAGLSVSW